MRFELATDTANVTRIKVIGGGGGGKNVVNRMGRSGVRGLSSGGSSGALTAGFTASRPVIRR